MPGATRWVHETHLPVKRINCIVSYHFTFFSSHILRGHGGEVLSCAWARHQPSVLATGAADSKIILWDVRQVKGII